MNNVATIRQARGLTQMQLADLSGVRQPHISRIEKGDDGATIAVMARIAKALRVELWELFAPPSSVTERLLIDVFRQLAPERQAGWIDMARIALGQSERDQEMH